MQLTPKAKQALKAKAHHLKQVVLIGKGGMSENVNMEIDRALTDHELIKIRIQGEDKEERKNALKEIAEQHQAEVVQLIGNVGILYRKKKD